MFEFTRGPSLSIWLVNNAKESWDEAEALVPGNRASCPRQFRARIQQLADTGLLRSPDHMNCEDNGIFAVKATCGLRAYGWFDHYLGRRAFIISHVCLKKKPKLDPADRTKAESARKLFRTEQPKPANLHRNSK